MYLQGIESEVEREHAMADTIKILLVDDSNDVRESVRRLLLTEKDFEVVGSISSGREGVKVALEKAPDIVIMDINMPDINGIEATRSIKAQLPATGVVMLSAQIDGDYRDQAQIAGATAFLSKPPRPDDLFDKVRSVHLAMAPIRRQFEALKTIAVTNPKAPAADNGKLMGEGERPGHVIVCFSPKGGVGTTTIATNLASGLMRENTKVLLIDADIQFGDLSVFLNLKAQSTIVDIINGVDDLDVELFENITVTHASGLRVLLGPARPEFAEQVTANPEAVAAIINKVRAHYDFVIVDTASHLDSLTVSLCDIATAILLIVTPTLPAVRSGRFVLDLFDQLYKEASNTKVKIVLSQVQDEKRPNQPRSTISNEQIAKHYKREIYQAIPSNEQVILQAIVKGVPVIVAERDTSRSPVKEFIALADKIRAELLGESVEVTQDQKASGIFDRFRRG